MQFPEADEWEFVNVDYKNPNRLIQRQTSDKWTEIAYLKPRPQFYKSFAEVASNKPVYEAAKRAHRSSNIKPRKMKLQQAEVAWVSKSHVGSDIIGKQIPKRFKKHETRKMTSEIKQNNERIQTSGGDQE